MSVQASRQILQAADTASDVFQVRDGGQYQLVLTDWVSGTWQLEVRIADGDDWISTGSDGQFSGDGIKSMYLNSEVEYRISGGEKGARAFLIPVYGGAGPYFP